MKSTVKQLDVSFLPSLTASNPDAKAKIPCFIHLSLQNIAKISVSFSHLLHSIHKLQSELENLQYFILSVSCMWKTAAVNVALITK